MVNNLKTGNVKVSELSKETFDNLIRHYRGVIQDVLGLKEELEADNDLVSGVVDVLIKVRNEAKLAKNYAMSDKIRDDLKAIGVTLKDGKEGTEYTID